MHELALAEAIAAIVEGHAGGRRVEKVEVKVGHLRQVVPDALAFGFELVVKGTALEGAELEIERVPTLIACRMCAAESVTTGFPFSCSACGSSDVELVAGDELVVDTLELVDSMERI